MYVYRYKRVDLIGKEIKLYFIAYRRLEVWGRNHGICTVYVCHHRPRGLHNIES